MSSRNNSKNIAPFGTWPSPISSTSITTDAVTLDEIQLHASGNYWIERRPNENGRCVVVRHISGQTNDILPAPFSARSRVHEYGGGAYCVTDIGLYFVNDSDQNIYHYDYSAPPHSITLNDNCRYADLIFDNDRQSLICVCEENISTRTEPQNTLVSIDVTNGNISTLCSGYDFYSNPRINSANNRLSWLCWNHPNMPWDGTELWLATYNTDNTLTEKRLIAGAKSVSIFQPEWSPGGDLFYISDITGWWNIYKYDSIDSQQLTNEKEEFGLPQWVFRQSTYTFINSHEIICTPIKNGIANLSLFNTDTGQLTPLDTPWNSFSSIHSHNGNNWFIASSECSFPEIICLRHNSNQPQRIRSTSPSALDKSYYSYGETITYPTRNNDNAYAIYYPPKNKNTNATPNELPPLIVLTHGGPTAMSDTAVDIRKQYWTSRGFAVLDVNYSGSTGFGREYRERLNNKWGIRDAEDCCDAALHMVKLGLADPDRLIIKGSSAGGYTVLCALTFHDVFSAGASYYGIGNLVSLIQDTHKFEAHYLDLLIGPYPDEKQRYNQRSPLQHIEKLNCPVIFFQGTEDKVVPKEQAEEMFSALKEKGVPVSYISFEGEQHGFRKAETIKKTLDAELSFYIRIFNLPTNITTDIKIENLEATD